ncbi:hypothetical protein PZN54_10865 [Staphylococcus capitis]|uniref:hypothetical protein n=1 Tax=Staphylococcus capitis TaxID=29388 RepID=UPI00247FAECD|nr:hypothetical protein [Staphylococcus capitis]MDH9600919.1 hypothetical protein [Staphylococcus capitis]MDH9624302.1 hypothetical protein [Staphylococcus capitis]
MAQANKNFPSLESSSKLKNVGNFETFDINSFIKGKSFAIERVTVDEHINFDVRIIEDNTEYKDASDKGVNKDKIIKLIIHESIADQVNIVNIIGRGVEFDGVENDDAYVYGVNSLQVTVKNLHVKPNVVEGFEQRSSVTKVDRRLSKIGEFKTFDYDKFLKEHEMEILTIYPQTPNTARLIGIITKDNHAENEDKSNVGKTFSVKIEMPKVRDIPVELLIGNKSFNRDNLKGQLYGMVIKNNQVLLIADAFELEANGEKHIVGALDGTTSSSDENNIPAAKERENVINNDVKSNDKPIENKVESPVDKPSSKFNKKNKFKH